MNADKNAEIHFGMNAKSPFVYLIALGSNQRHSELGSSANVVKHAVDALEMADIDVVAHSPILRSAAIGPSQRQYSNSTAIIITPLSPPALLARLHDVEAHFGRKRRGERWRARVLDLDIILWSGGIWADDGLSIPHPAMRTRDFVLCPAAAIAPDWRDPVTGLTICQLQSRLSRPKPLDAAT